MNELLQFFAQVGRLKDLPRAGWVRKELPDPESVAAHSYRTAVLALLLAPDLGIDADRLVRLVLVHDLPESDPGVGDITPHCGVGRDDKRRRERRAMERLCAGLADGDEWLSVWLEYDAGLTAEADAAHQLDALEMALQAREYEARHGVDLSEFLLAARRRIRHPALLRLIDAPA